MAAVLASVSICVSARITDSPIIQKLAVAYRNQIPNRNTWLFAQTGKLRTRRVLTSPQRHGVAWQKWGNQRTADPKTKQNETPPPESIATISQTASGCCAAILTPRPSLYVLGQQAP